MDKQLFLRIALPTPLRRLFDYLPPQDVELTALIPGSRVSVPFQSRSLVGILIEVVNFSSVPYSKLKRAHAVLDDAPILAPDVYKLCQWAADYYHHSLGEVFASALPVLLRRGKEAVLSTKKMPTIQDVVIPHYELNAAQQKAVDAIKLDQFQTYLLDGVTGSGKTEVYLRAMEKVLALEKQILVLVPEISLTPQTVARFRQRFAAPIVALHSNLSEKARLQAWLLARSGKARIVIGTRSAVFTPFESLGLIIVDEEHDGSFKQQDRFRYHARDTAVMRAHINQIPIVLGSATPSLESLLNVKRDRYQSLQLPERAGNAQLPTFELIDMQRTNAEDGLSMTLLNAMREQLALGNQVMLFLNRRGFAPVWYCAACSWMAGCKRCDAKLVYHRSPTRLQCHQCDSRRAPPTTCEQCKATGLQPIGLGTQRLEETLTNYFKDVPIIRVDRDSTRKKSAMQDLLTQIHKQKSAILVGTQMLAKGHHFPNVTLVGIIDADSGLFSADFRAAEQMGQLLLQVSGRAGREEKAGVVMIQTRHPDNAILQTLTQQGYATFAKNLLIEREQILLPPYSHFAIFRAEAYAEQQANHFLVTVKNLCDGVTNAIKTMGPVSALMSKRKGLHCQQLLIKAEQRGALQRVLQRVLPTLDGLKEAKSVKWILDVDPMDVL